MIGCGVAESHMYLLLFLFRIIIFSFRVYHTYKCTLDNRRMTCNNAPFHINMQKWKTVYSCDICTCSLLFDIKHA